MAKLVTDINNSLNGSTVQVQNLTAASVTPKIGVKSAGEVRWSGEMINQY